MLILDAQFQGCQGKWRGVGGLNKNRFIDKLNHLFKFGVCLNFVRVTAEKVSHLGAFDDVWAGVGRNRQFCYLRGPSVNFVPFLVPAVEDPVKYRRLAFLFINKKSQPTHVSGLVNNKVRPVMGA